MLYYILGYFNEKGFTESNDLLEKFLDEKSKSNPIVKKPVTLPDSDSDNESDSGHSTITTTSATSSPSRSRLSSSNSNSQLEMICDKETTSYLSNDFTLLCTKPCCSSRNQALSRPSSQKSTSIPRRTSAKNLQKKFDGENDGKLESELKIGLKTALTVLANRTNVGLTTNTEKIIDIFVSHLGFRPNKLFIEDLVSASSGVLELRSHLRTGEDLIQFKEKSKLLRITLKELTKVINLLQHNFKPDANTILKWKQGPVTFHGQSGQQKSDFIADFIQNKNNELLQEQQRYNSLLAGITEDQANAEFLSTYQIPISCKKKMLARRQFNKEIVAIRNQKKLSSDGILTKIDIFIFHFLLNQSSNFICANYILNKINFNRPPQLYFHLDDLKMTFTRFHMNGLKELEMKNDRFGHFIKISNRIELYNLFYKIQESQNKSES